MTSPNAGSRALAASSGSGEASCLHCGKPLVVKKRGYKKYCDDRCKGAFRRSRNPEPPAYVGDVSKLPAHLTRNFTISDPDECWIYARRGPNGYAQGTSVNNFQGSAYRLLFMLMVGPIPEDRELDHLCDNGAGGCVNWHHIRIATHQENMTRPAHTLAGRQVRLTHCPKGHPYSGDNLILTKRRDGVDRECRICKNARRMEWHRRNRDKVRELARRYEASPEGKAKKAERQRRYRERQRQEREAS